MNIRESINKWLNPKAFDPLENIDLNNVIGWRSIGGSSSYGYYHDNQYENGYSSISKLANGFAQCEPKTIDKNGKPVSSNLLDRIYTPNTDMSAFDFREALAVTSLVHDKVRLRVHHKGTRINMDSILGFTFMEDYFENVVGGKRTYKMPNGELLDDDVVITLKSINPDNITGGFSASRAAKRWTRLDDYIADYQKGFFENGAVPSGQLIITSRTVGEFNEIVDTLQARHKGASNSNNITYTHRPTDQNGSPLNSQIEWVPFSSQNKDMALKDLFDNVNKKIDSVYGVPQEIRGQVSNSNYASVTVAEKVFVKYALYPLTLKVWSKFTHEMNRITGGLGVAVSFDMEIPVIADEAKVESESKQIDAALITAMTDAGYSLDTVVDAFDLPITYKLLRSDGKKPVIENDQPDILTSEEAKGTPEQPIDVYAKSVKYIDDKFAELKKEEPKTKQLSDIDKALYEFQFERITQRQMERQVNKAIDKIDQALEKKAYGDTSEEEDKEFTAELLALMIPLMTIYGNRTVNTALNLIVQAELSTQDVKRFEFTPSQKKKYEKYLAKIGTGYADQTAEQIRQVLGEGILNGVTKAEIEANLRKTILGPENEYRVRRLARTEVNLSEGRASVYAMENIQSQTGYSVFKEWHTSGANPCPFCDELNGTEVLVDEAFIPYGDSVKAGDQEFINNWTRIDSAELHANCNCYTTYRVERG